MRQNFTALASLAQFPFQYTLAGCTDLNYAATGLLTSACVWLLLLLCLCSTSADDVIVSKPKYELHLKLIVYTPLPPPGSRVQWPAN